MDRSIPRMIDNRFRPGEEEAFFEHQVNLRLLVRICGPFPLSPLCVDVPSSKEKRTPSTNQQPACVHIQIDVRLFNVYWIYSPLLASILLCPCRSIRRRGLNRLCCSRWTQRAPSHPRISHSA
jgi:hypothetical protein